MRFSKWQINPLVLSVWHNLIYWRIIFYFFSIITFRSRSWSWFRVILPKRRSILFLKWIFRLINRWIKLQLLLSDREWGCISILWRRSISAKSICDKMSWLKSNHSYLLAWTLSNLLIRIFIADNSSVAFFNHETLEWLLVNCAATLNS